MKWFRPKSLTPIKSCIIDTSGPATPPSLPGKLLPSSLHISWQSSADSHPLSLITVDFEAVILISLQLSGYTCLCLSKNICLITWQWFLGVNPSSPTYSGSTITVRKTSLLPTFEIPSILFSSFSVSPSVSDKAMTLGPWVTRLQRAILTYIQFIFFPAKVFTISPLVSVFPCPISSM